MCPFPITQTFFYSGIKPLINKCYSNAGRPPKVSDYNVFCAMIYVLRTGISWKDLPPCYGNWHSFYQ